MPVTYDSKQPSVPVCTKKKVGELCSSGTDCCSGLSCVRNGPSQCRAVLLLNNVPDCSVFDVGMTCMYVADD